MQYFTSDLHLGHAAVIGMQNRPFESVTEMNNKLIHNINACVGPQDELYILGDITHNTTQAESNRLIRRIHGKKYLILGNHDITGNLEQCEYDPSLFAWIGDYRKLYVDGMKLILMHYPMMSWPKAMGGSIMLHGHIHADPAYNAANQKAGIRRYDVGVDANNYFPVSLMQLRTWAEATPVARIPKSNLYVPGVWNQKGNNQSE